MKKGIALLLSLVMLMGLMNIAMAQETLSAAVAGFGADVTVTVDLDDEGKILSITADGSTQTPALGGAAADTLNEGALAGLVGMNATTAYSKSSTGTTPPISWR